MKITLPDESIKELPKGVTGLDVAESIGPGLAKSAIAVSIDGMQKDLSDPINSDCSLSVITLDSEEGLEIMRHTIAAQVLALAIKNIYPDAKLAIGPTIENGFYYDFLTENTISTEDLPKIEKEMKKILLAAAFSLAATSLSAGSMATPKMEEPVVSASSSSGGSPLLILLLLLVGVAASG